MGRVAPHLVVQDAVVPRTALADLLDAPPRWTRTLRLEPGMGVICNNVLHDRSGFVNAGARQRLVLRARFVDRVAAPELEAREWKRN